LTIELVLDIEHGSDLLRGRVTDEAWGADLLGDLAPFRAPADSAPFAGQYTMTIPLFQEILVEVDVIGPDGSVIGTEIVPGSLQVGQGVGTVKVETFGNLTVSGRLADGTKFTQRTRLSRSGRWPLYASLYRREGLIQSWVKFSEPSAKRFAGDVVWIRPATPSNRYLQDGFTQELRLEGMEYDPQVKWWINGQ
jgi:hypothetical protein